MAVPQIGALPAVTSPAAGLPSPWADLGLGLGNWQDIVAQERAKQEQARAATMTAGQQVLDTYKNILTASPEKASDPSLVAGMQAALKQMGLPTSAMVDPGQPGANGQPGAGGQINLQALGAIPALRQIIQTMLPQLEATQPQQRGAVASGVMGRPLQPGEEQQLEALPYQLPPAQQVAQQREVDTNISAALKQFGTGNMTPEQFVGRIKSLADKAIASGSYTEADLDDLMSPEFDQMSPAALAKINQSAAVASKDSASAASIKALTQSRVDLMKAKVGEAGAMSGYYNERTHDLKATLPARLKHYAGMTAADYAKVAEVQSTNKRNFAEASYYSDRAHDLVTSGGSSVRLITAAMPVLQRAVSDTDRQLQTLTGDKVRWQSSLPSMTPEGQKAAKQMMDKIDQDIGTLQKQKTQYQQSMQELIQQSNIGVSMPVTQYPPPPPDPTQPGAANPAAPAAPQQGNGKMVSQATLQALVKGGTFKTLQEAEADAIHRGYQVGP